MELLIVLIVIAIILFVKYMVNKDDKFVKDGILLIAIIAVIFIAVEVVFKIGIIKWLLE